MIHAISLSISLSVVHQLIWLLRTVDSEPFVHTPLDLYAFIALAPSSSTVDKLIEVVESDNNRREKEMDRSGNAGHRSLNVRIYVVMISLCRRWSFLLI